VTPSRAKAEANVESENEIPQDTGGHATRAIYESRAACFFGWKAAKQTSEPPHTKAHGKVKRSAIQ
jgi:hypothetical protein